MMAGLLFICLLIGVLVLMYIGIRRWEKALEEKERDKRRQENILHIKQKQQREQNHE